VAWCILINSGFKLGSPKSIEAKAADCRGRCQENLSFRIGIDSCVGLTILCLCHIEMDICAEFLRKRKLPHQLRRNSSSVFDPAHDSIMVMMLHVSKGLEFSVVALVGAGRMPAEGEDEREEARLSYVGATRATQQLVIGASGGGKFAARL